MEKLVSCKRISNIQSDLTKILEEINWRQFIKPNEKVLIKPNICFFPSPGTTTSPEIIHAAIEILREQTDDITIVETDYTGKNLMHLAELLDCDVPFLNLSHEESMVVDGRFGSYNIPNIVINSKIVNIPVFKAHNLTQVTFGIKNLFGLLVEKEKEKYHVVIDKVLYDLYALFRPQINILDGIYSMDQIGPTGGRIRRTEFIMASTDALALDMAACSIINIDPLKVGNLVKIHKDYPCQYKFSGDRIKLQDFVVPKPSKLFLVHAFLKKYTLSKWFLKRPIILNFAKKVEKFLIKMINYRDR